MHLARSPCSLAFDKAGNRRPARMAMMAMTTSSSMRVNAWRRRFHQPCRHQDAKESVRQIKTIPAEHRLRAHFRERAELVEDKLFERLIKHAARESAAPTR